eukprot:CAMPEP_0171111568 /NCGR_PEP_ID=MMETSP0766_2-20121228/75558_1 /TAXON_ID=439317 /ORGANISM="Gambierdiscus australes, Strain CAWD 149" /LENGTH=92 /DNA_ID=CAMNT_0011573569 /DNA_START=54 /DNA_END=329 /DNA_ORIENTATION=-
MAVRNTGAALELSIKGQATPVTMEFASPADREAWCGYIRLASEALTSDSERAALEAARASHRQLEMDKRRTLNEERKKQLSENLGMRYTAEA